MHKRVLSFLSVTCPLGLVSFLEWFLFSVLATFKKSPILASAWAESLPNMYEECFESCKKYTSLMTVIVLISNICNILNIVQTITYS